MEQLSKIPTHVTIIMDGNGRWAKMRGMDRLEGHKAGVESVRACTEFAVEKNIKYLSLFAFSTENWGRPTEEVEGLWALMFKAIEMELKTLLKNNVRFLVLGNLSMLSEKLQQAIASTVEKTKECTGTTLIVMLNYSGKWDITQAAQRLLEERVQGPITEEDISSRLVTANIPEPDLMIRTSGEMRISNYMLWQTAYTEFYFADVLWPDFRKPEFAEALESFAKRDRRYGKV